MGQCRSGLSGTRQQEHDLAMGRFVPGGQGNQPAGIGQCLGISPLGGVLVNEAVKELLHLLLPLFLFAQQPAFSCRGVVKVDAVQKGCPVEVKGLGPGGEIVLRHQVDKSERIDGHLCVGLKVHCVPINRQEVG